MYQRSAVNPAWKNYRVVDLRSDTLSVPTDAIRQAITNAVVGDDVYGEDPSINELEARVAELLGKEASVFVPSGTMANLLAILVHCDKRGSEMMAGNMTHIFRLEQGGCASLGGVFVQSLQNFDDGTFSIDSVRTLAHGEDIHEPITQMVAIEQTHNATGGKVLPLEWIEELSKVCKERNLKLHMDGARIFNAAEYLKVSAARVARDVDSVCFCLSKGLCCPVGSLLAGTKEFVTQARRLRKALGGGMRQAGFLAAAGLCALETIVPLLKVDHKHARELAEAIDNLKSSIFKVDLKNLQTNILMIKIEENAKKITSHMLMHRMAEVKEGEVGAGVCDEDQKPVVINAKCRNSSSMRVVFYQQINDELTQLAIKKIIYIMKEMES